MCLTDDQPEEVFSKRKHTNNSGNYLWGYSPCTYYGAILPNVEDRSETFKRSQFCSKAYAVLKMVCRLQQ